jgi:hypothetical protein
MFFASAVLLLSSYVSPSLATTSVEQMGVTYGQTLDEMMITFASFSELDATAQCNYGTDANDLRYCRIDMSVHSTFLLDSRKIKSILISFFSH